MIRKNYELPAAYHLSYSPGAACFLEPPGHPRYFVRAVYTRDGNNPNRPGVPQYMLNGTGYDSLEEVDTEFKPLPYDHPRVQAWERYVYAYFRSMYTTDPANRNIGDAFSWPVPAYKLDKFRDDERFSDEWRTKEKAAIEQRNADTIAYYRQFAVSEHHLGYLAVKKHYPEAQPRVELENGQAYGRDGTWWERLEEKPTPENCPGSVSLRTKHPVNRTWCQVCGWHEEKKAE